MYSISELPRMGQFSRRLALDKLDWQTAVKDLVAVLILVVLPFMVFWTLWAPNPADRVIFTGDVLVGAYPTRVYVHRLLINGEIPLWNPYQLGGMPLLADAQVAVYYLPNLLFDLFYWGRDITYEGLEALILAHYVLGAVFMYGYLRQQKVRPAAALIGAIAFEFNGFFIGHRGHYSMLSVVVWVPGVMWLLDKAWHAPTGRRGLMWAIAAGFLLSQLFMGGHPQLTFYSGLFLIGYFFFRWAPALKEMGAWWAADWRAKWSHPLIRTAVYFGVAGVLALSIAMISLLPMFELLGRSLRSEPSYAFSVQYPLMPRNFISLFIPEFLNWSGTEFRIYAGILTLVLTLVTWMMSNKARPEQRFFTAVIAIAIIMAMGGFTALHGWLYRYIPGFDSVRVTARLFYFANISLAVLAAFGADALLRPLAEADKAQLCKLIRGSRWLFVLLGIVALGFYMLLAWYNQAVGDEFYFYETLFVTASGEERYLFLTQMMNSYMLFVFFLAAAMIWLWLRVQERVHLNMLIVAAVLLITIDITTFAPHHDASPAPDFERVGLDGFAIYEMQKWQAQDRDLLIDQLTELPPYYRIDNSAAVLPDNFSQLWPASFATGYNVLDLKERFEIQTQWPLLAEPLERDLMAVHLIMTSAENPDPPEEGAQLLLENSQGKVWQRPQPPAYAHFSNQIRQAGSASITINGLLTSAGQAPFTQPAVLSDDEALSDILATAWPEMTDPALYQIGETGVSSPVDISVLAGGPNAYSAIVVNGETLTPEERGMLLVVVDAVTGDVLAVDSFDTYVSAAESDRLAAVINGVAEGQIVALSTYDEGTAKLTDAAREALLTLGGAETLVDKFGQSYALIGVKGAAAGTAVERVSPEPFVIDVGLGAAAAAADVSFASQVVSYEQDQVTLLVENNTAGLLTISETVFPGWQAYVDGEPTPILRANGMLRSIVLPPAPADRPHEVTFIYRPTSVRIGTAVTVFAILMAIGLLLILLIAESWPPITSMRVTHE